MTPSPSEGKRFGPRPAYPARGPKGTTTAGARAHSEWSAAAGGHRQRRTGGSGAPPLRDGYRLASARLLVTDLVLSFRTGDAHMKVVVVRRSSLGLLEQLGRRRDVLSIGLTALRVAE